MKSLADIKDTGPSLTWALQGREDKYTAEINSIFIQQKLLNHKLSGDYM